MPSQPQQGMVKINELQVNPEYETLLPFLLDEDLENLEKSVLEEGILHPLIINPDKVVLDGHHRLIICRRHSINEVPFIERSFDTDLEEMEFVISFNLNRRHLSMIQKVELGVSIFKMEMEKARQRQEATQLAGRDKAYEPIFKSSVGQISDTPSKEAGRADEIAAKKVGLSRDTLRKGKDILDAAEKSNEAFDAWLDIARGEGTINKTHQKLFHKHEEEEPPIQTKTKLEGVFQVIVIDLPILTKEKLKRIGIPFDETNCVLWLWTPFRSQYDVTTLLIHWGFFPQTMLTWVKNRRGSGKWLLNQTEYCILATRGNHTPNSTSYSTALIAISGKHHSKPDEFYSLVESLCPGRKLNVSSKMMKRPGWEELEVDSNAV